jgi:hypothetical protein
MPSFRLFFIVALLVAIAFAAPAPARRSVQKRSFKVPRQLNKAHPTGPNGMLAMRKVFRKYNFQVREEFMSREGLIGQTKASNKNGSSSQGSAAAAADKNQTGTVMATPEQNAALFLSPVTIGGQTLNLDFDSGSSDLYVKPPCISHFITNTVLAGCSAPNYPSRPFNSTPLSTPRSPPLSS